MPRESERSVAASGRSVALGGAAAIAGIAFDPSAPAADAKRVVLLVVAVVSVSLVIAGGARLRGARRSEIAPACGLWIAFVSWSALTLAWGVISGVGTLAIWVGATGILAAAMTLSEAEARRAARVGGTAIGGASAAIAVAQFAAGARGLAVHGGHGNPNWLGLGLAVALPLSVDFAIDLRREGSRFWLLAAAAAALKVPALALSHSRVGWAAAALAIAGWAVAARFFRGGVGMAAGALAAALIAKTAVASTDPMVASKAIDIADISDDEHAPGSVDASLSTALDGRTWIWRASVDAARRSLPFGEGLGGFPAAYLDAQGERLAELDPKTASRRFLNATTAHCDWIEAAVSGGLPAFGFLAATIASGVFGLLKRRRARSDEEPQSHSARDDLPDADRWPAGAASLVAFAGCAIGDSPMHQPAVMIIVALVLGACPRTWRGPRRTLALGAFGLGLAAGGLLLATSVGSWLCDRRLTQARDAMPEQRLPLLVSAARLDPRSGEAALAVGLARLELGDGHGALADLARSRALLANIGTDVAIGNAHMLAGSPDRAAAAYERTLARNPSSFRAHTNLAQTLTELARFNEAAAHLAAARALWPGHPKLAVIAERLRKARIDAATEEPPVPK